MFSLVSNISDERVATIFRADMKPETLRSSESLITIYKTKRPQNWTKHSPQYHRLKTCLSGVQRVDQHLEPVRLQAVLCAPVNPRLTPRLLLGLHILEGEAAMEWCFVVDEAGVSEVVGELLLKRKGEGGGVMDRRTRRPPTQQTRLGRKLYSWRNFHLFKNMLLLCDV